MTAREMTEEEALSRLATLCSKAERCAYEMTEKMRRWGLSEDAQARDVSRLTKDRYIDNARYARAFARDKAEYNKWGSMKIRMALRMKHIDDDVIDEALSGIEDKSYEQTLRHLLEAKAKSVKASSDYERRQKLIRFALGRGFTYNIIERCLPE